MLEWLWGLKTVAIFDVWSIEHLLSGLSIGSLVKKDNRRHLKKYYPSINFTKSTKIRIDFLGIMFLAYMWETLEHYLEEGIAGKAVEYWFQGVEFWPNRFIADPLMLIIGYWLACRYPKLVIPARIFSGIWLFVHIFVFPHSMYLHELF
ncbi:hypothetical protein K9M79_07275 [Candidatus Woesearchaeota archaeon]|nr:hypothetical protein [Candidatus Woesearchaeota archaeon]